MKRFIILITILFSSINAFAQESNPDSLQDRFSLLFQIGPNFNVQSLAGSGITMGWRIKSTREIRFSLNLVNDSGTFDERNTTEDDDRFVTSNRLLDSELEASGVQMQIKWISEFASKENLHFYYGFGPSISFVRDNIKTIDTETNGSRDILETTQVDEEIRENSYGLGALLGSEYKISKQLSLFAEYHGIAQVTSFEYGYRRTTSELVGTEFINEYQTLDDSGDSTRLGFDGARFGLIFRF